MKSSISLMLLTVSLATLGCGNGQPKTYPVKTQILVNGSPASGATVILHPVSSDWSKNFRHLPAGKVESDGSISFSTFAPNDGAPAGEYVVTIDWPKGSKTQDALRGEHESPDRPNPIRLTVTASKAELSPVEIVSNTKSTRR